MSPAPTVAAFRPDDGRLAAAEATLSELGVEPLGDPMLAVEPTGAVPRGDAAITVFTSATGVERAAAAGWAPGDGLVCAIGEPTRETAAAAGIGVDVVPERASFEALASGVADRLAAESDRT